jgi:hypothetical protein
LKPELARRLSILADVESTGGATVYRFTETSLRRGFDAGQDATEIKDFLARTSRTPVPQPLEYLLDDIARRHGAMRVGAASSYLRCDDPDALTALLAERVAGTLQLRRLAPTVAVSPVSGPTLLDRLQGAGYAPVLEGGDGVLVLRTPQPHRARPVGAPQGLRTLDEPPSERLITVALKALRHGEDTERTPAAPPVLSRPLPERSNPSKTLAVLRGAVADGAALRIGYAGSDGSTLEHLLDPVHVAAGQLTAYDHRGGDIRTFAVSRITGVEILTERTDTSLSATEEPA